MALSQRIEVERIENMVINFGWRVIKQEIFDDDLVVTICKPLHSAPSPKGTEGAV